MLTSSLFFSSTAASGDAASPRKGVQYGTDTFTAEGEVSITSKGKYGIG